jgi:hypothetical protein
MTPARNVCRSPDTVYTLVLTLSVVVPYLPLFRPTTKDISSSNLQVCDSSGKRLYPRIAYTALKAIPNRLLQHPSISVTVRAGVVRGALVSS